MHILLLASDTSVGFALAEFLQSQARHTVELLTRENCRWKSERQSKKALRRSQCDLLIDARISAAADSGETLHDHDIDRIHWLAKACHRNGVGYLYLSSSRVFSGSVERLYTEDDYPDNNENTLGELLLRGESFVRDYCERYVILRMGPIFSSRGSNALTHLLEQMKRGNALSPTSHSRGSPVYAEDAARVVAAMCDQLSTEADVWGIYHYCSDDVINCYDFTESLLAATSGFIPVGSDAVVLNKSSEAESPLYTALYCAKIRNTFAIHQMPWRKYIAESVVHYFEAH